MSRYIKIDGLNDRKHDVTIDGDGDVCIEQDDADTIWISRKGAHELAQFILQSDPPQEPRR